jgi:fructose-bisphosphate aldolase class I
MSLHELESTIQQIAVPGKGILAADESQGTITKRFNTINLECTTENRRAYRDMLFTTPELDKYVNGVILFEETLGQRANNGKLFPEFLAEKGIIPGIKVDKGVANLPNSLEESYTQGLDGLHDRLATYKEMGARFAKWRAVLNISDQQPSCLAVSTNAEALANYAAICQDLGIVPIVEPELLMDGNHSIDRCAEATEKALREVFAALNRHKIILECMILKPNMVIDGTEYSKKANVKEVAEKTVKILKRTVPAAVPTINFLSGGQSSQIATAHLNAMNQISKNPWLLSFSYGRALQDDALKAWHGKAENVKAGQDALHKRVKLNSLASRGEYVEAMEK